MKKKKKSKKTVEEVFSEAIGEDDIDEETSYETNKLPDHSDSFEKWFKWFQTTEDHEIDATAYEAWNGAVDTIALYISNLLHGSEKYSCDEIDEIIEKIKTFKSK